MFDIFRKKRIDRYAQGASGYVACTYVQVKKEPYVRYSIVGSAECIERTACKC